MNFKEPSNPAATSEGDKSGAGGGRIRDPQPGRTPGGRDEAATSA